MNHRHPVSIQTANNKGEAQLDSDIRSPEEANGTEDAGQACPLDSQRAARIPGLLALAAMLAALVTHSLFFGLAGGLLGVISILLAPPRCRWLGTAGVLGSVTVLFLLRL